MLPFLKRASLEPLDDARGRQWPAAPRRDPRPTSRETEELPPLGLVSRGDASRSDTRAARTDAADGPGRWPRAADRASSCSRAASCRASSSLTLSFGAPSCGSGRGHRCAARDGVGAQPLQPVAQRLRSNGSRRGCSPRRRARTSASIVPGRRPRARARSPAARRAHLAGHVAREAVERLELLDRVALDAGAQRLPDDGVQIDEALGAQQAIELVAARRVSAHQPLQRGRLVVAEVVDVHARVGSPRRA